LQVEAQDLVAGPSPFFQKEKEGNPKCYSKTKGGKDKNKKRDKSLLFFLLPTSLASFTPPAPLF
jgi:hypothetical protein